MSGSYPTRPVIDNLSGKSQLIKNCDSGFKSNSIAVKKLGPWRPGGVPAFAYDWGNTRGVGDFTAEGKPVQPLADWLEFGTGIQIDLDMSGAHLDLNYQG